MNYHISVPTRDELDLAVAYLKEHYVVVEKEPDIARMCRKKKRFWHYLGSLFLGLLASGPMSSPRFPISEAIKNIPYGTKEIEIRIASA